MPRNKNDEIAELHDLYGRQSSLEWKKVRVNTTYHTFCGRARLAAHKMDVLDALINASPFLMLFDVVVDGAAIVEPFIAISKAHVVDIVDDEIPGNVFWRRF
jgi:hypothetical protein